MSTIQERPILFNGPMVRGTRKKIKTQTRRVVKNTGLYAIDASIHSEEVARRELKALATQCPYGKPGDRLWVRETWGLYDESGTLYDYSNGIPKSLPDGFHVSYPADDAADIIRDVFTWKPSIHMPRFASRILLEIVSVRVERLNDISEEDAKSEGIQKHPNGISWWVHGIKHPNKDFPCLSRTTAREMFAALWDVINGSGAWLSNPWVWAVEFKVIEGGEA